MFNMKEYQRKWYAKNKRLHKKNTLLRAEVWRQRFYAWKKTLHCQVCSEHYWKCLDFHHLDPTHKDISIGNALNRYGQERLRRELEKCVCLCKNCHTKVHDGEITLRSNIKTCVAKFGSFV